MRRRAPSSATVKPAPSANPSSTQSTAAKRRTRPGATIAATTSGANLPASSMNAAKAIPAPSSLTFTPAHPATTRVSSATTAAQGTPTENIRLIARHETVRVRPSSAITIRHPSIAAAGTSAANSLGTTARAATISTNVMR